MKKWRIFLTEPSSLFHRQIFCSMLTFETKVSNEMISIIERCYAEEEQKATASPQTLLGVDSTILPRNSELLSILLTRVE